MILRDFLCSDLELCNLNSEFQIASAEIRIA